MHRVGTLIIGGGIAGASLAAALAEHPDPAQVFLADVDLFGKYSSSELNGGGVRSTFAEEVNVRVSLESVKYYRSIAGKIDYLERGYLWMYDAALWDDARQFLPVIRGYGLPVEEISPAQLVRRYPFFGDTSDLAGVTVTPADGRLSPHKLRIHYLNRAESAGVQFLDRMEVVGIEGDKPPYTVSFRRVPPRGVRRILTDGSAANQPVDQQVVADVVVNAAGPWAARVARMYGSELPVAPNPRQVFLLQHPAIDMEPLPFFIDYPREMYYRHYVRNNLKAILVSWSDPQEPRRIDFTWKGEPYYRQHIAPRLVPRIPLLAEAKLLTGWAGHYELSADKSAVMGPVPGKPGIHNYNGLSAHGVMQSRGLGLAMATFLRTGTWPQGLDLTSLAQARFVGTGKRVEKMYV